VEPPASASDAWLPAGDQAAEQPEPETGPDAGDGCGADAFDVEALDAIERDLADVERALAALDEGGYGRCEVCGNALDDDHLERAPAARFCADHLPLPLP